MPSNYVKKEKKSLLDKIIPRKIHSTSIPVQSKNQIQTSNDDSKITYNKNGNSLIYVSKAIVKHKYNAEKYLLNYFYLSTLVSKKISIIILIKYRNPLQRTATVISSNLGFV